MGFGQGRLAIAGENSAKALQSGDIKVGAYPGLIGLGRSEYIYQTAFPRNHPVCRLCNYSQAFATYGDTITDRTTAQTSQTP